MQANNLMRIADACAAMGKKSRSAFYADVQAGLMVKPVKIGPRASAIAVREVEAVNAARLAGKNEIEIRELVERLHQQRSSIAALAAA